MTELHVVALSGGKDSTAMALRLQEISSEDFLFVCTPTRDELPEMFDHWRSLGERLGKTILPLIRRQGLNALVDEQTAIPNWRQRWCTRMLKIEPWHGFLSAQIKKHELVYSYVGLRADEPERQGGDYGDIPGIVSRFPLREWGWGLSDVQGYLERLGVSIPSRTDCARCFYQSLPEWWTLWKDYPDIFEDAVQQESRISEARGKPCTWRSPGRDTWPAPLVDLRSWFERGKVPKGAGQTDLFGKMKCRVCRT